MSDREENGSDAVSDPGNAERQELALEEEDGENLTEGKHSDGSAGKNGSDEQVLCSALDITMPSLLQGCEPCWTVGKALRGAASSARQRTLQGVW